MREARRAKGLTQRDLADKVGISRPFMTNIETGYANPPLDLAIHLSQILGVPVEVLFAKQEHDIDHTHDGISSPAAEG